MVSKKKIHYSCVGEIGKSVPRDTICHYSASLVMPKGDPQDEFCYPFISLIMDSFNIRVWIA